MSGLQDETPRAADDERIPEPDHGSMPSFLRVGWIFAFLFLIASVLYAFWPR